MRLDVPLPPASLRRNHGATKWQSGVKDEYSAIVYQWALMSGWRPSQSLAGPLKLDLTWRQTGHGDVDNCLAGAKALLDCLGMAPKTKAGANRTYLGIYEDDAQIVEITVRREQVKRRAVEGITLTIERW